jgi:ureidoglycolate lyase
MKLARYSFAGASPELGVVTDAGMVPLTSLGLGGDMIGLITRWGELEAQVRDLTASAVARLPMEGLELLAPIPRPGKVMAIGLNYADHIAESKMETPLNQIWFSKAVTSVTGPFAQVQIPKVSGFVDYEAEMVAVIGSGGKHISREDAPAAVFGWCVGNDVTERAWQHRTPQWVVGKSFDTHAPHGPWITTSDEIADPHALNLSCTVNGEVRQSSNTRHLVFDVWAQLEHLSQAMTLQPGDLIFTGTPGGIGAAMEPRRFLKAGDHVRVEIEGLGAIDNPFAPEPV